MLRAYCIERRVTIIEINVRNNDVDQALRLLKRRMQREGLFREIRRLRAYEKPSERRVRVQGDMRRRHLKFLRKRREREGY